MSISIIPAFAKIKSPTIPVARQTYCQESEVAKDVNITEVLRFRSGMTQLRLPGLLGVRFRIRQWTTSLSPAVILSIVALMLSGATFYINFVHVKRSLTLTVTRMWVDETSINAVLILANPGNRAVAVGSAEMLVWGKGKWNPIDIGPSLARQADSASNFSGIVVEPARVQLVAIRSIRSASTLVDYFRTNQKNNSTYREIYIGVRATALSDDGRSFISVSPIGAVVRRWDADAWDPKDHVFGAPNYRMVSLLRATEGQPPSDWVERFIPSGE